MSDVRERRTDADKATDIVRDAGGKIVGRTRFQKLAYLLEITGLGDGFSFVYRHYGPYSEQLAGASMRAGMLGRLMEVEHSAQWGGKYSVFTTTELAASQVSEARRRLIDEASRADPIALELAATAAFLAKEGHNDPWAETQRRKPEKSIARLSEAKALYSVLQAIDTPTRLPTV